MPLHFKGDKKPKKRKRENPPTRDTHNPIDGDDTEPSASARASQVQKTGPDADLVEDDDSWVTAESVSDVSGPVVIVLPTDAPSALACDAAGSVFAMPLENIVDGSPASAEPHDVRQVWVASRVAGTESFRFKGHHKRYLACDKIGRLSATSEAVSPVECFNLIVTSDAPGTFQLQTLRDTFISVKPPDEVRGDADAISFTTTMRIRMQARFKPKLRAKKEEKALSKISRSELEAAAGRKLTEDEVKLLKRARREGDYHEKLLDVKIKGKHDKFA